VILGKLIEVDIATIDIQFAVDDSSLVCTPPAEIVPGILDGTSQLSRERQQQYQHLLSVALGC